MSDTHTLLAQAQQKLSASLALLPEGKRNAIAVVATTEGAKVALVSRPNEHWQIEAFAAKPWDGDVEAGGSILIAW